MKENCCEIVKSEDIIGKKVLSNNDEKIGKIEEIVLDKSSGQVRYVVLSCGGFLGLGENLYAIPWKSISYDPEEEGFKLMIDSEKLKSAPNFEKSNWPNFADPSFEQRINSYYS